MSWNARRARAVLRELEIKRARNSLAVYAGLQIPQEVESEGDAPDFRGMHKLSMAARYVPAEHHRLLISALERVEAGEIKRLMVFMPPGSAKSTYGSVLFPSWYLGRNPDKCLIQGSYNDKLASRFGRRARNTFASPLHREIFGVGLAKDSQAQGAWTTEQGGEYVAFGMQTGITGWRADGAILDDPIKGRKEADSKTERDNAWETYKADIRTRMKPGAFIVYIATRWHEDDPAGRILKPEDLGKSGWVTAKDGEKWYVISLPAVIETPEEAKQDPLGRDIGEILWPEWFSPAMFAQEKIIQGTRNWNALYQQKPRPDEGAILKRAWWREWKGELPKIEYLVSVYDTAFEEGEENDSSARTSWGVFQATDDRVVNGIRVARTRYCVLLLDHWEDKVEFPELKREAVDSFKKQKPDLVLVEKKASGHSLIQALRRIPNFPIRPIKVDRSKLARAYVAQIVLEDGCVYYLADKKWPQKVIGACASATFKKGDPGNDTPDTCVHAWNWLREKYHLQLGDDPEEEDEDRYKPAGGGKGGSTVIA